MSYKTVTMTNIETITFYSIITTLYNTFYVSIDSYNMQYLHSKNSNDRLLWHKDITEKSHKV